jgi:hypothetical protein
MTRTAGGSETKRSQTKLRRNEAKPKRNGRLRFGPRKSLICIRKRNRPLRLLLSFQCVEPASQRENAAAPPADPTALGATNYDTDHSDFQEEIVAATACVNLRALRHCHPASWVTRDTQGVSEDRTTNS